MALSLHDATLVIHALKDGPYDDADIKRIVAAIDAKVMLLQSSKAPPDTDQFPWPTSSEHEVLDKPKVEKKSIKRDADSLGIPLMPNDTRKDGKTDPVQYLGSVIYTVDDQRKFRCLKTKGDKYSEICKLWGGIRTKKEAWDESIAAIQAHKK